MDIKVDGWGEDGQIVVACGERGLCFANPPMPVVYKTSELPPIPKHNAGDRVILTVKDGAPAWKVREVGTGSAMMAGGGTSLFTTLLTLWTLKKVKEFFGETNEKGDTQ